MQPTAIGPHHVCRRGVLDQDWKGRLLGFKKNNVEGMVAIVQHVYSLSNIHFYSEGEQRGFIIKLSDIESSIYIIKKFVPQLLIFPLFFVIEIFPSSLIEEQSLRCLSGTLLALHATIGNIVLACLTPLDLAQGMIFFYSHNYIIPKHDGGYGKLKPIIAPSL